MLKWARTRRFRLFLCVMVSVVCLYLAVRGVNVERTLQELGNSAPAPIAGAVFFLFVSFWLRAWRWGYLLLPVKKISILPLFRSTLIGFMGNYVFPFRAGEVMRAVSIGQTQSISKPAALGSILLERVCDGIALSLTPFLLLAAIDLPDWVAHVSIIALAILVAGLLTLAMATRGGWTEIWLDWVEKFSPKFLAHRIKSVVGEFIQGMKGVSRAGAVLPVLTLSLVCWFFHGLYFFLLFEALDLKLSFWAALILQMVIGLGVILPAAPGYVGSFEYFTVLGLALFGTTHETAFAYALLAHVFQFVPVTVVGALFAFRNGFQPAAEVPGNAGEEGAVIGEKGA